MSRSEVVRAVISAAPLDLATHLSDVEDRSSGAVAVFLGRVRDHAPDADGEVLELEYSAHPSAEALFRTICERVLAGHASERSVRVSASHRVGTLAVGDAAIIVAVSTAHRDLAQAISRDVVETVKRELPIWKRQRTAAGDVWVGLP